MKVSNTLVQPAVLFVCRSGTGRASLTDTCSTAREGKHLSDMFPIRNGLKQGDALTPLLLNFAVEYAIRRFRVYQDGLN